MMKWATVCNAVENVQCPMTQKHDCGELEPGMVSDYGILME